MNTPALCASVLAAALLGGCSHIQSNVASELNASDPITCPDRAACDRLWQRLAQRVDAVTAHKFKERTDTRLTQWAPVFESTDPFVSATRLNAPDGSGRIGLEVLCMNPFGCFPAPHELAAALRVFVRASD